MDMVQLLGVVFLFIGITGLVLLCFGELSSDTKRFWALFVGNIALFIMGVTIFLVGYNGIEKEKQKEIANSKVIYVNGVETPVDNLYIPDMMKSFYYRYDEETQTVYFTTKKR